MSQGPRMSLKDLIFSKFEHGKLSKFEENRREEKKKKKLKVETIPQEEEKPEKLAAVVKKDVENNVHTVR